MVQGLLDESEDKRLFAEQEIEHLVTQLGKRQMQLETERTKMEKLAAEAENLRCEVGFGLLNCYQTLKP